MASIPNSYTVGAAQNYYTPPPLYNYNGGSSSANSANGGTNTANSPTGNLGQDSLGSTQANGGSGSTDEIQELENMVKQLIAMLQQMFGSGSGSGNDGSGGQGGGDKIGGGGGSRGGYNGNAKTQGHPQHSNYGTQDGSPVPTGGYSGSTGGGSESAGDGNANVGTITGGSQSQQQAALKGNQEDIAAYGKYYTQKTANDDVPTTIGENTGDAAGLTSMGGEGNTSIQVIDNADGQNMTETEAHEFNHAHTSDAWNNSSVGKDDNANEATTDWLAQQATGGYTDGVSSGYQANDDKVQKAVDAGLISKDTLAKAYFSGDQDAIAQVQSAYQQVGL
jgi:hypothetical protein